MGTNFKNYEYTEWFSADQMHETSKVWLSELKFIKDEHHFFEDLITSFTYQILAFGKFSDTTEIIDAINKSEKQNIILIQTIKSHKKELKIMVDGMDQLKEEKAYIKAHKDLIISVTNYLKDYKSLKTQLFKIIKNIKKEDKQRHLLDKREIK